MENDNTLGTEHVPSSASASVVAKKRPASTALMAKVHDHDQAIVDPFSPRKRLKRTPPKGTPTSTTTSADGSESVGSRDHEGTAAQGRGSGGGAGAPRVLSFASMTDHNTNANADTNATAGHTPAGRRHQPGLGPQEPAAATKNTTPPSSPVPFSPSRSATQSAPRRPSAAHGTASSTRPFKLLAFTTASKTTTSNAIPTGRGMLLRTPLASSSSSSSTALSSSTPTTGGTHFHPTLSAVPATPLATKVKHTTAAGAASAAAAMPPSRVGSVHRAYDFTPSKPTAAAAPASDARGTATRAIPTTGPSLTFTPRCQPRALGTVAASEAKAKRMTFAVPARQLPAATAAGPRREQQEQRESGMVLHRHLKLGYNPQPHLVDCGQVTGKIAFALPGEVMAQWEKVPEYVVDVRRNAVLDSEVHDVEAVGRV